MTRRFHTFIISLLLVLIWLEAPNRRTPSISAKPLPSAQGTAQNERELETKGVVGRGGYRWGNGKAWKLLDGQSKITYLTGIQEGAFLLLREASRNGGSNAVIEREAVNLNVTGFRESDLSSQVDGFYNDSANLRIPVVDAYKYVLKKLRGAKTSELDAYISELRQTYNQ
jgi:hypothetical protein